MGESGACERHGGEGWVGRAHLASSPSQLSLRGVAPGDPPSDKEEHIWPPVWRTGVHWGPYKNPTGPPIHDAVYIMGLGSVGVDTLSCLRGLGVLYK